MLGFGGSIEIYDRVTAPSDSKVIYEAVWSSRYDHVGRSISGGPSFTAVLTSTDHMAKSIALDPANPQVVYAGNYRSTDGGQSWSAITGLPHTVVQIRAQGGRVYAWTEGGLYKSVDQGQTWVSLKNGTPLKIASAAVDPTNSQIAYAVSDDWPGTLLKTTDGGNTWTDINVGTKQVKTQRPRPSCWAEFYLLRPTAVAVDPYDPQILWASGKCNSTYKTADGGVSWKKQYGVNYIHLDVVTSPASPSTGYLATPYEVAVITGTGSTPLSFGFNSSRGVRIAVDANGKDIYAAVRTSRPQGLYKANLDQRQAWTQVNTGLPSDAVVPYAIAADPRNSGVLYAGVSISTTTPAGIYKTTDGAQTWTGANTGLSGLEVHLWRFLPWSVGYR